MGAPVKLQQALGCAVILACAAPPAAFAQRAGENAAARAEDAFGVSVGGESIGIYSPGFVRAFSAVEAGNIRIGGLSIDQQAPFNDRLIASLQMRVGLSAQSYPFPAPTGVADYALRIPGEKPRLSSQVRLGPYGGAGFDADFQAPLSDAVFIGGGVGVARDKNHFGGSPDSWQAALIGQWRPSEQLSITPFWSHTHTTSDEAQPLFLTDATTLPPAIPRGRLLGQPWAQNETISDNAGVLASSRIGEWSLRFGLFHSVFEAPEAYTQLFLDAGGAGTNALELVIADPPRRFAATSTELRASRSVVDGDRLHTVHLSLRGRQRERVYGGGAVTVIGRHPLAAPTPIARPDFTFAAQTRDEVEQASFGFAYEGRWRGVGEISLGAQRTAYSKTVFRPGDAATESTAHPWLLNATLALTPRDDVALYASYTQGLEESPIAPDNAVNRTQAFPAVETEQLDAGFRWALRPDLRWVLGAFAVEKPAFALDAAGRFGEAGAVRHQGLETSLTGQLTPDLTVVLGTMLLDARISRRAVDAGLIGTRPVGSFRRLSTAVLLYRPSVDPNLTLDAVFESSSDRVANQRGDLFVPARTTVSLGARYRLMVGERASTLRVQVGNAADVFGYGVGASGVFVVNQPRRATLTWTIDW